MNLNLLIEFSKRDFTERYSGSILGVAWSFIWPLVNMAIYIIIFSKIMGAKLPGNSTTYGYSIYLVAGLLPWTAFCNTVQRASTVFVDKKHIISKIPISLPLFPLFIVISESFTFLVPLAVFMLFLLATGAPLPKSIVLLPFIYLAQQVFAYALGFLVGIFNVFLRDLKELVGVVLQIWFWFTPIVYVSDILPDFAKELIQYNPAYLFIKAYQDIFAFNQMPDLGALIILTLMGHLILVVGYAFSKTLEKDVRDFL